MSTAAKQAVDPGYFVPHFVKYAKGTNVAFTVENIQQWDAEENGGKMRAAIFIKYGEAALVNLAIKELFKRYLYNGTMLRIKAHEGNPVPFRKEPMTLSGIQRGVYVPASTADERQGIIAVQTEKIQEATRRLKLFGMTLKQIQNLVEEAF